MTTRSEARLLCRQLGREVRNAALSITDTSSCSRETPCLRGLISILMSCSEAQLGLPTPAGHSHSFTCNYHQTQGAPFPHPQPPPQAWTCTDFQRLQQYTVWCRPTPGKWCRLMVHTVHGAHLIPIHRPAHTQC